MALSRIVLEVSAHSLDNMPGTDPAPWADQLLLLSKPGHGLLGIMNAKDVVQRTGTPGLALFKEIVAVHETGPRRSGQQGGGGAARENDDKPHGIAFRALSWPADLFTFHLLGVQNLVTETRLGDRPKEVVTLPGPVGCEAEQGATLSIGRRPIIPAPLLLRP